MSNKFYTFVGMMDNVIYHRYYDENKNEVFEKVEEYDYTLYVEHHSDHSGYKSLQGRNLKEFKFRTPSELSKFYRENKDMVTIHGNDSAVHQFIAKEYNYDVKQTANVNVINFDIEVEHGEGLKKYNKYHQVKVKNTINDNEFILNVSNLYKLNQAEIEEYRVFDETKNKWVSYNDSCYKLNQIGFPDPQDANGEIMSISVKKFGSDEIMYSIGTKPLIEYDNPNGKYIQCKDEKEVIVQFLKVWRDSNPQYVTGWNIDGFDIPYLCNRIKKVLGKKALAYLSPFKDKVKNNDKLVSERLIGDKIHYEIFGVTSFDYIELYKKYNPSKQETYKLDYIGEVEIGQRKVNFDEYKKSLMNLYEGEITVDTKSKFSELDEIMKFARLRELTHKRLEQVGFNIENDSKHLGESIYKIDVYVDEFDYKIIKNADNETLKGIYNYCDERVKTLSYKKFVTYNEQDAHIVELLDNKMKFIKQAIRVAHMSKSRMKEIFGTVAPWDNMIYSRLLSRGVQIPPRESFEKDEKFAGAYVKDPILGFHRWVATVDLKSLYPSIIRMGNMSPETMRKSRDEKSFETLERIIDMTYDLNDSKNKGFVTVANGASYTQEFEGVLPETMKFLMEERDIVKTEMKDVKNYVQHILKYVEYKLGNVSEFSKNKDYQKSYNRRKDKFMTDDEISNYDMKLIPKLILELEDEISMLEATQLALKILANSGYGAIGNAAFRYFRIEIAEGITLTGQLAIKYMSKVIDDYLNKACGTTGIVYAIYGDTDSIFISLDNWVKHKKLDENDVNTVITAMDEYMNDVIEPLIADNYEKMSDYLGAKENLLIMKREVLSDATIFRGKKNYIMQVYDNEHVRYTEPYMKMMGVETAKSSTAMIIRKKLEECFKIIINKETRDVSELKAIVDDFRKEFNEVDIVTIARPSGVNDIDKWIDEKGNIISGCPIHVRGAIVYNQFIKSDPNLKNQYEEITNSTKIRFVNLKQPNILHSHVVAFIDDIPPEMELEKSIDRKTQFDKTFMVPLESFTQLIDWDVRRSNSLSSLFDEDSWDEQIQLEELEVKKEKLKQTKPKKMSLDSLFE